MNFKSWLINELTEVDPKQIAWLSTITPDTLLNYEDVVPFVYSATTDKLYWKKKIEYHNELIDALADEGKEEEADDARMVRWKAPGVVGRIAYAGRDKTHFSYNSRKTVPNDEAIVAFYTRTESKYNEYIKRSLQLLMQDKLITRNSYVVIAAKINTVDDLLGHKEIHLNDEEKRLGALQVAMHLGAWPDGRRITAAERKYIMKELGMETGVMRKHAWQKSLEDNKLLTPGHRFWAQKSESIQ